MSSLEENVPSRDLDKAPAFKAIIEAAKILLKEFPEAEVARQYISSRISQKSTERFEFGFFPKKEHIKSLYAFVDEKTLELLNLKYTKKSVFGQDQECFTFENNNLIFPYKDIYGNILGIAGRTLFSEAERSSLDVAKYRNTSFKKRRHLYGMNEAKKCVLEKDCIYVVEGQFDCIKCFDKGIENVVALGSSSMAFDQMALILRYTDNVKMLLDNDAAGQKGMEKAVKDFGHIAKIETLKVPEGYKDIDEYLNDNDSLDDLS